MGFALQHADAVVELVYQGKLLIGACVIGSDKRCIVGRNECDVAVGAGAELRVVVAGLSVDWSCIS